MGVGGDLMAAAGCELLADPVKRSAMLVGALLTGFWYWSKLLRRIRTEMAARKPDVVIPIDSSFINLRVAAAARELGMRVCYYVAPQVWASRPGRVRKIKACVDTLCCVLPFEETFFRDRGVHGVYVGHPMFDEPVEQEPTPAQVAEGTDGEPAAEAEPVGVVLGARRVPLKKPLPAGQPRIALFPGSRRAEIHKHMPAMLKVIAEIKGRHPRASFVAAAPSEERAWQMRHHLRSANVSVDIRSGHSDAVIRWADLVLAKSGTITLQVARQGRPMVVMFAVPAWQWALARHLIHTPYIALVNILAGREIVPEFIPFHGSPRPVAEACLALLGSEELRGQMLEELRAVVAPLHPQAGKRAADLVAEEVAKLVVRGE